MNTIPVGALGFSATKGLMSKIIIWGDGAWMSHCFTCVGNLLGVPYLSEATFPRIKISPLKDYMHKKKRFELYDNPNIGVKLKETVLRKMHENSLGKPYGTLQLFGFAPVILFKKLFGIKIKNPIGMNKVCSEWNADFLNGIGWGDFDPNETKPSDIYNKIKADPEWKLIAFSHFGQKELIYC